MRFRDAEFMTAGEKLLVLKQWERLIKHLAESQESDKLYNSFTKRVYSHLIQHCSFIAHYDRSGFFNTYFRKGDDTVRFIKQFDGDHGHVSVEYGDTRWYSDSQYHDLNEAMCKTVDQYKREIYSQSSDRQRQVDLDRALGLLSKHDIQLVRDGKVISDGGGL